MTNGQDIHFMRVALSLARRGLGRVWPNPSVGCVIVKNGLIIGQGRTADAGRPHAEAAALEQAGERARGATAYITLEPCAVAGRAGPCADALITAGIARAVVACLDHNPVVFEKGIARLKDAGIEVVFGVLEAEASAMNKGFFLKFLENRPFVTLKTACSLDGKIATVSGESQWITGDLARRHTHLMRASHDAVLCGIGTALADDPLLTAREGGLDHRTVRVVLDSDLRLPHESKLVRSAVDFPLWIVTKNGVFEAAGVTVLHHDPRDLKGVLGLLSARGITRLLVEGGASVHTSFLKFGLWDEMLVYRAPTILGGDGLPVFGGLGIETLAQRYDLRHIETQSLGPDRLERYERQTRCSPD